MRSVCLTAVMLVVTLGCEGSRSAPQPPAAPAGNLVFQDAGGAVVAVADLELPEDLPDGDGKFEGRWKLLSSKSVFPSDATETGSYKGSVYGGDVSINLNPRMADDNVILGWPAGADPVTGTWYHATFAGGKPMGTFTLTRRPGGGRSIRGATRPATSLQ